MPRQSLQNLEERLRRLRVRSGAARHRALAKIGAALAGPIAPDSPDIIALAAQVGCAVAAHGISAVAGALAMMDYIEPAATDPPINAPAGSREPPVTSSPAPSLFPPVPSRRPKAGA
jgi:hypothetical protein